MYKASFLLLMLLLPATLSATDNVAIVEGFVAAYNRHDVDGMLEFVAPDVRWMSYCALDVDGGRRSRTTGSVDERVFRRVVVDTV